MLEARLLDPGCVTALRSQTLYHAVAEGAGPDSPVTLCIPYPDRPYVSIGYHQEAAREIDLDYCRERGIPVLRRKVGGGAVLLDEHQLFFHLIIPHGQVAPLGLPRRLADRYPVLTAPAIAAYRRLGVEAGFRPANDIHVGGRKIGGTGAASIGDAFVFVGSMILDFDHALMARVLRFPDERMREEVRRSMERYVTSLFRETGTMPSREDVREALLEGFREKLGLELVPGELTSRERALVQELDEEFEQEDWLHYVAWTNERARTLNINCAVRYLEAERETPGGLLRLGFRLVDGRVDDVLVGGDLSAGFQAALGDLRATLLAGPISAAEMERRVRQTCERLPLGFPGPTAEDVSVLTRKLVEAAV